MCSKSYMINFFCNSVINDTLKETRFWTWDGGKGYHGPEEGGSLFSRNTATWQEICIREYQLLKTLRVHTHNTSFFKVPYHKSVKRKNDLVPWAHATARWSLPVVHLIYSSSVEHWHGRIWRSKSPAWHWWIPTERCRICISRWWIPNYRWRMWKLRWGAEIQRDPPI